jgi:hypothetical protein
MTYQSKPRLTAPYRYYFAAHQAARLTQATFSTYTHVYLSVVPS